MRVKTALLDQYIILMMFALLPVDMVTGIMLKYNILLPLSISQLFKLGLLLILFLRFLYAPRLLVTAIGVTVLLLLPTLFGMFFLPSDTQFFSDLIKVTKFLMPVYCFLFFAQYIKRSTPEVEPFLLKLVNFSYWILIVNILVKHIGLGYPAYANGDIGTKGFFFAGNEISALLIILVAIKAFDIWKNEKKGRFYLFLALNLFAGLTISSKTAILGIILVFFAIPFLNRSFNVKKLLVLVASVLVLLPVLLFISWQFIVNSALMLRWDYFYQKFDFWTFILSTRNVYLGNAWDTFGQEYSFIEKIIGVGQSRYEQLNGNKIVEMDIADIFFAYGAVGLFVFMIMLLFVMVQSNRFFGTGRYPYARFVFFMVPILFLISTMAGHVFGSGMSAVFLGLLFSLMYFRKPRASKA